MRCNHVGRIKFAWESESETFGTQETADWRLFYFSRAVGYSMLSTPFGYYVWLIFTFSLIHPTRKLDINDDKQKFIQSRATVDRVGGDIKITCNNSENVISTGLQHPNNACIQNVSTKRIDIWIALVVVYIYSPRPDIPALRLVCRDYTQFSAESVFVRLLINLTYIIPKKVSSFSRSIHLEHKLWAINIIHERYVWSRENLIIIIIIVYIEWGPVRPFEKHFPLLDLSAESCCLL